MAEHNDIYLCLVRQQGAYKEISANKYTAPLVAAQILKGGLIVGDSMDAPFVGFIKCEGIEHSIGMAGEHKALAYGKEVRPAEDDSLTTEYNSAKDAAIRRMTGIHNISRLHRSHYETTTAHAKVLKSAYESALKDQTKQRNAFINSHLPEHEEFTFSKLLDRSTPQLAFGCSAQERFPLALFMFRRKTGMGIAGIRWPQLVCALRKVRISSWKMVDGDKELVTLKYGDVAWASLGSVADSNTMIPLPSARTWDQEAMAGGQTYSSSWAYGAAAVATAMCALAGGAIKTASLFSGGTSGSYS